MLALVGAGCGGGPIPNGFQNPASGSGPGGSITVPPAPVTITITPTSAGVQPNGTISFNVSVQNATNTGVDWFVNGIPGGNQTVGTISSTGRYTAPSTPPTPNSVVVSAVSQQDITKQAQSVVVISVPTTSIRVTMSPSTITLQTGASTVFTATVTGTANTGVTWRVNGIPGGDATVGTVTASGAYTAPASVPVNPVVSISATSVSDPSISGTAFATIVQRVSIQVSPAATQVQASLSLQFSATVTGTTNTAATWAVNGIVGGNSTVGTVSSTGLYTAPAVVPQANTVTVSATSIADPTVTSFATVTIVALGGAGVTVSVTPVATSVNVNQTLLYVATVTGFYRGLPALPNVAWHANGLPGGSASAGFIVNVPCPAGVPAGSDCGQYTAPSAVPLPNVVTVTAFSVSDPSSSASVSALITAPTSVSVAITPSTSTMQTGAVQQFTAVVTGSLNQGVTWTVNGVAGGNATVGTITAGGLYTAPPAVPAGGAVLIGAASVVSPTATASASVTIQQAPQTITVTVAPANATLQTGTTQQFTATVAGTANQGVTWSVGGVAGGNATVGTISPAGLYTAPASVPAGGSVLVSAASVVSPASVGSAAATVTAAPPVVSVAVSPPNAALQTNATQQFTAVVTGSANQSVTWSVNGLAGGNPLIGTISAAGLYTAPAAVPPGGASLITATSVASPTSSGSASVTVQPAPPVITVAVTPGTVTLQTGNTQQFTAAVTGTANQGVTWSVGGIVGGNATIGTISAAGLYTAPASVPAGGGSLIAATSVVDPTAVGSASVTVVATPPVVSVTVSPPSAALQVSAAQQFTATVSGVASQSVTWAVNGVSGGNATLGTISAAGLYTAPSSVPAGGAVLVTATSTASPTSAGAAGVSIIAAPPPLTVTVNPSTVSLRVNDQFQFTANVSGTTNQTVTWQVNGVTGGNATVGTISASGLYTAPASALAPAVTVTAVSTLAPNPSGSASVTVQPVASISMNPTSASVGVGAGVQFFVNVGGLANTAVTFAVNGIPGGSSAVGTISAAGLYIAPSSAPAAAVTVQATSVADPTLIATSTVTVVVPVIVSVTPGSATIAVAGTQQFSATVTNSTNQAVTWAVNGIVGGSATVGTISASGLYTAPANLVLSQSYTISARSVADPTVSATASVTVNVPVVVAVSPTTATVSVGGTAQFNSTVTGATNTNVTWSVSAGGGSMTAGGLYTAPATVPSGTVTVTATSVADPTKSASATVTVQPGVSVVVSPITATVVVSQTQQFNATVTGTATTTVTWSVTGGGTIDATTGLYTAPATVPAGAVTVTATSQDGTNTTGTATVTVAPTIGVSVSPSTVALLVNQTQQFTATVTGSANQTVTWSVTGGGSINTATGLYTAPAVAAGPITVTATSAADATKTATATVTVTAPPSGVFVSVFPRNKNLPVGNTQKFIAHVIRISDQSVTWSVNGVVGGNATVGTIDASGLYSPPSVQPASPNITVTACSVQVATACMTVNARIVPSVVVSPASAKIPAGTTLQLTPTVTGAANSAVTWEVNGVPGGDARFGTVSASGLFTPPATVPPGLVRITARSVADTQAVGHSTLNLLLRTLSLLPLTTTVLPGGRVQFQMTTHKFPTTITPGPIVTWTVNGIVGGNSTVGTISPTGLYRAPQTSQTVTVVATSVVDPTLSETVSVNIAPPVGASTVSLLQTLTKVRPYYFEAGAGTSSMTLKSARNQYVSWQVLVEGRLEDLTGVNLSVSDFVSSSGSRINASNAVIYLEKYVNVPYASRADAEIGEYPDPLIPKVDPIVGQARNAFPFSVNRISPAYRIYPQSGGATTNANFGAARATSGGVFTGTSYRHFVIEIDRGGGIGTATFRWSNDGGANFVASNVPITSSAIALSDGVTVTFASGNITGTNDFVVGNQYWIYAGPFRNQPVWFDLFVPAGTPTGVYNGTVTVVRSGKANVTLNVSIDVQAHTLATSSRIPSYFGMNWTNLQNAHFFNTTGPETMGLGQLYGVACLINRINCDTASVFQPAFTFNTDGSIATSDYTAYDQATAPLANGSLAPHGEQLAILRLPRVGATPSEQYFATENMLSALTTRGWRSRVFDLSFDEPTTAADAVTAMTRASLVRSVDNALRTAVTADITNFNSNLVGYVNRWVPNFATLEKKEFLDGPSNTSRAFYDAAIAAGDELWWYGSCKSHDCTGTGVSPRFDNYWSFAVDASFFNARLWGLLAVSPYKVQGILYQDTVAAYARSFGLGQAGQRIDVWESTYYHGASGEGTLFYPGRPSDIGGTVHIPIETLRLKYIRDSLIEMENASDASAQNSLGAALAIRDAFYFNEFSHALRGSNLTTTADNFLVQLSQPTPPQPVDIPPRGGSFLDPVTGNRIHVVTDSVECQAGAKHNYSYWPVWNSTGTHLFVECDFWRLGPNTPAAVTALLIEDSTLAVVGDALQGAPAAFGVLDLLWSPTDPQKLYARDATSLWEWNPFTRTGNRLFNFSGLTVGGTATSFVRLAYVSTDDRFFLMELMTSSFQVFAVAVFDRQAPVGSQIRTLDVRPIFILYDEGVITKGNRIWLIGDAGAGLVSRSYTLDLSSFVTVSDHGHHAHGLLPNGTPVAVKEASNRECFSGLAGNPPGQGWKPTALILNETINSPSPFGTTNPLPSELFRLGCQVPGQHAFSHYSWNNTQTDRFFISSLAYSPPGTDPLANAILRVRLGFDASNQIISDTFDVLALHRSEPSRFGYFALPRASCNQQGTRCLFASSMSVNTTNTDTRLHLYIVDVP